MIKATYTMTISMIILGIGYMNANPYGTYNTYQMFQDEQQRNRVNRHMEQQEYLMREQVRSQNRMVEIQMLNPPKMQRLGGW